MKNDAAPSRNCSGATSPGTVEPEASTAEKILRNDLSLLIDFIAEAYEHLHHAELMLLNLETDPKNRDTLDSIFRAWHSIKGIAGFLGLKEVATLAHAMESKMDVARGGEVVIQGGMVDSLLAANDCLRLVVQAVERVCSGNPFVLPPAYRLICAELSKPMSTAGESVQGVAASDKKVGEILVEKGLVTSDDVEEMLNKQHNGDSRKIGRLLLEEKNVPARAVASALAAQQSGRTTGAAEETIRVPVGRIDMLVDSIGEAIIAQSLVNSHRVVNDAADQELLSLVAHAGSILRQIQQVSMSLRMVAVRATFQKMARIAHDLSAKCGKEVEFVCEGEETELDKSVVENISDPLVHMVRNAIDHGIELPQKRLQLGKTEKAFVRLKAFHQAGAIFIEVSDNGAGLNRDAIFAKAVEKNLCRSDAQLSDNEVYHFVFVPGFSTAREVTDVSGRGVGMDVVHRNIELLRGSIDIASVPGRGTTFTIKLPLTLAVVDGMVVKAGTERYIIPTLSIIESVMVRPGDITTIVGKGAMISLRGEHIPVTRLTDLLEQGETDDENSNAIVMVVEDMLGHRSGLLLNSIIGQQQVVIKNLGAGMGDIPGITGGAILNDGSVCLILDIGAIVKLLKEKTGC